MVIASERVSSRCSWTLGLLAGKDFGLAYFQRPVAKPISWLASGALAFVALCSACVSSQVSASEIAGRRPNILLIVADDLGFSDIGAFGGEIDTPNLDRLAYAGTRFTDFYAAPSCSPTRAMLMTGRDNHAVGLGTMAEALLADAPRTPGYEGFLRADARTIAELFREGGYRTMMAGKWHLGKEPSLTPDQRGFDRSYVLLDGAAGHYGIPQGADVGELGVSGGYREDGNVVWLPVGQYAGDVYSDRMIDYMQEARELEKPFFGYVAFTGPHWPLQAPKELIEKYRGRYEAGPVLVREQRLKRMVELGLIRADAMPAKATGNLDWLALSDETRARSARTMEVYAAMVERLDQNVGQILEYLHGIGQLDNTIIVFLSDNGAEAVSTETLLQMMRPTEAQTAAIDNSLGNMGRPNSYIAYGPEWAQVSAGPFHLFKGYPSEGGIRIPAFIFGPGVGKGRISSALLHVTDIFPTLAEMTGVPDASNATAAPPEGKSFAGLLQGSVQEIRANEPVGWELFQGRALRQDNWKAMKLPPKNLYLQYGSAGKDWMLFDLFTDIGETQDLSEAFPEKLEELKQAWGRYAEENGVELSGEAPLE